MSPIFSSIKEFKGIHMDKKVLNDLNLDESFNQVIITHIFRS